MNDPRVFASLTPTLLARKGGARPAMRRQDGPPPPVVAAAIEDLGWNDFGTGEARAVEDALPEVLRRIERVAAQIGCPRRAETSSAEERRAAFTLRLDAERHFRLRMAGVLLDRSAQRIVTEALDKYLSEIPEVAASAPARPLSRREGN